MAAAFVTVMGSALAGLGQPAARPFDLFALAFLLVTPLAIVFLLPRFPATAVAAAVATTGGFLLAGYPWGPAAAAPVVLLVATILSGPWRRGRAIAWAGGALLLGAIVTAGTLVPPIWSPPTWNGQHGPPWSDGDRRSLRDPTGVDSGETQPGETRPSEPQSGDLRPGGTEPGKSSPGTSRPDPTSRLSPAALATGTAWTVVALLVAGAIRDRTGQRLAARDAARQSAAERERTAVTAERLRIARELHDVLAHSLSGINVQAGVGLHLLDRNPDQARSALSSIRDTSRDALAEVRTLLGIVRVPFGVTWDLSGLESLATQSRAEGLAVSLQVDAPNLPDRIAGAVHRVVQESLTNVRRHAVGATRVSISVGRDARTCTVIVSDDGRAPGTAAAGSRGDTSPTAPHGGTRAADSAEGTPPTASSTSADATASRASATTTDSDSDDPVARAGTASSRADDLTDLDSEPGGYGLRGMRERVEALDGTLSAGPDEIGWLVRATFPLPEAPT